MTGVSADDITDDDKAAFQASVAEASDTLSAANVDIISVTDTMIGGRRLLSGTPLPAELPTATAQVNFIGEGYTGTIPTQVSVGVPL